MAISCFGSRDCCLSLSVLGSIPAMCRDTHRFQLTRGGLGSLDGVDAIVVSVNLWGIQSAVGCLVLEVELTEPHGPGDAPVS